MKGVFGEAYSAAYDVLYRDKDYAGECDLVEHILAAYGPPGPRSILDLGCGTGEHSLLMSERGHSVTGVDFSAGMLEVAREKARLRGARPGTPLFVEADLRWLNLGRRFDAALMMFAVIGYQHDNPALMAALASARRHLAEGGLFVFDCWYGPAVITDRPGDRVKRVEEDGAVIVRTTRSTLDLRRQTCRVSFHLEVTREGTPVQTEAEEHVMRFFFPLELELALEMSGFRLETLRRFPNFDHEADEASWHVIGVAVAVGQVP